MNLKPLIGAGVLRAVPVASVVRESEFQYTLVYLEENGSLWTGMYIMVTNFRAFTRVAHSLFVLPGSRTLG